MSKKQKGNSIKFKMSKKIVISDDHLIFVNRRTAKHIINLNC